MRHSTILCVTQQFGQDVNFIYDFDIIWSSKWLWSIIFLSKSSYLDDRTFPGFLPKQFAYFPTPIICICRQVISIFVRVCCFLHSSSLLLLSLLDVTCLQMWMIGHGKYKTCFGRNPALQLQNTQMWMTGFDKYNSAKSGNPVTNSIPSISKPIKIVWRSLPYAICYTRSLGRAPTSSLRPFTKKMMVIYQLDDQIMSKS